jgi:hypothetical protein
MQEFCLFRMKLPRRIAVLVCLFLCAVAFAAEPGAPGSGQAKSVLPKEFAGWQVKDPVTSSPDPAAADEANAPVLKEYGFQHLEKATYTRDDGRKLTLKAAVFADASGAYGAFTYYKSPGMLNEQIGAQGSSLNNRILFYQGNVMVDAIFDKLSVMSAAQLRELAADLPLPEGNAGKLPGLLDHLPKTSHQLDTPKYVMGPVTLDRVGSPLPTPLVDFRLGAEVVIGKYSAQAGEATLMLIEYPTMQIAAERLKLIDATRQPATQQPGGAPIVDVAPFFDKRTGPILVIAAGPLSLGEVKVLLGSVSYDADVTWNENTYVRKKDNLANLLFNVIVLCGILMGFALLGGLAFGGFRVLMKRLFPDTIFDRPEEVQIISLHLEETLPRAPGRR